MQPSQQLREDTPLQPVNSRKAESPVRLHCTGDTENGLHGRTAEREALNNDAPDITAWDAEEDKGGDIIQN